MFFSTILIYVFCHRLTITNLNLSEEGEVRPKIRPKRDISMWISLGKYLALTSLCVAAVLRPSVPGGFYFLIFLSSATWWACNRELQRGFAIVLKFVMFVVFLHIGTLYAYQFQTFQEFLEPNATYAR